MCYYNHYHDFSVPNRLIIQLCKNSSMSNDMSLFQEEKALQFYLPSSTSDKIMP